MTVDAGDHLSHKIDTDSLEDLTEKKEKTETKTNKIKHPIGNGASLFTVLQGRKKSLALLCSPTAGF